MTDSFMSGWGRAEGLRNVLIFVCSTREEADHVAGYAEARSDMSDVRIHARKPKMRDRGFLYQVKTNDSYSSWYPQEQDNEG